MNTYEIHDNGGRPFIVHVYPDHVEVYKQKYVNSYELQYYVPDKKVLDTTYQRIWIGDNVKEFPRYPAKGIHPGNSILLQVTNHKYIFIGWSVYSFEIEDEIHTYSSYIGNSDVPYPYAVGIKKTYFLLDRESVPNEHLRLEEDAYLQFYRFFRMDPMDDVKQPFAVRTIAKRDY